MPAPLRPLLAACVLLAACDSPSGGESRPVPETPLEWVEQNAHVVQSIDVNDRDYDDLEGLRDAIGDARVVMLGEQSHTDGTTFLAKARLAAFLHREMGFDVLAWESGIYNMDRAWQRILAGADVQTAARNGMYPVWGASEQVRPVLAYVASTLNGSRPLELAGFDITHTGTVDSLDLKVAQLARDVGSSVVSDPAWASALVNLRDVASGRSILIKPSAQEQEATLRLLATLRTHASAAGGRRALWWAQTLESLRNLAQITWALQEGSGSTAEGRITREDQMSRNLLWLANEHYRGRKIIVWAATTHIARNLGALDSVSPFILGAPGLRRMGEQVHAVLGDDMYSVGFTAARGTWGRDTDPLTLQPPREGSLEAHLDQLGMAYAFVDLREPGPGGEWLREMAARSFNYDYSFGDWPRVLDGMFYTREMIPSATTVRLSP